MELQYCTCVRRAVMGEAVYHCPACGGVRPFVECDGPPSCTGILTPHGVATSGTINFAGPATDTPIIDGPVDGHLLKQTLVSIHDDGHFCGLDLASGSDSTASACIDASGNVIDDGADTPIIVPTKREQ